MIQPRTSSRKRKERPAADPGEEEDFCAVCLERQADATLQECRHRVLCSTCAFRLVIQARRHAVLLITSPLGDLSFSQAPLLSPLLYSLQDIHKQACPVCRTAILLPPVREEAASASAQPLTSSESELALRRAEGTLSSGTNTGRGVAQALEKILVRIPDAHRARWLHALRYACVIQASGRKPVPPAAGPRMPAPLVATPPQHAIARKISVETLFVAHDAVSPQVPQADPIEILVRIALSHGQPFHGVCAEMIVRCDPCSCERPCSPRFSLIAYESSASSALPRLRVCDRA